MFDVAENESFPRQKKFLKKLLTNESGCDKISELPLRTKRQRNKLILDK